MKSYTAYKNRVTNQRFVMLHSYAASLDHETRYVILAEINKGQLRSPTVVPLAELEDDHTDGPLYYEDGIFDLQPDAETVTKAADSVLQGLVKLAISGKLGVQVAYGKNTRTVTVDGAFNLNDLLSAIL